MLAIDEPAAEAARVAECLTAHDRLATGKNGLVYLTPFFKASERNTAGCQHRLFFSQVEYCDNLIFHRRAALDQLGLDSWMPIGPSASPTKLLSSLT